MQNQRIWELDALRGVCILGMIAVHTVFDLVEIFCLVRWDYPPLFLLISRWGSTVFLLLSGICASFSGHSPRRGLTVLGCGLLVTAATWLLAITGWLEMSGIIWFGTLHCLGSCMLLWLPLRRVPSGHLFLGGLAVIAAGAAVGRLHPSFPWLLPLGLVPAGFASGDYFPVLPCFGYFLLGAIAGRRLYREKASRFPHMGTHILWRPLCFVGRHSLWFYLAHQPVIAGILMFLRA